MPRIKAAKSKRMSSKQRHKIDRKKREHKRDLRKAAKALKDKGLGPQRSKKTRNLAKLALQISNTHPDKEAILNSVLKAREHTKVEKGERRKRSRENNEEEREEVHENPVSLGFRQLLYVAARDSNNFKVQFLRSLTELVFPVNPPTGVAELPSVAYVITLDSRFAVQCLPWTLLDAIVEQGNQYRGGRKVLLLFAFTKVDLVSISALITQISLVAHALSEHFDGSFGENIVASLSPISTQHDKTARHLLRILSQFGMSDGCSCQKMESNLMKKVCAFVIGFPNTGRRSLCRFLTSDAHESTASAVPFRAAQLQIKNVNDNAEIKFAIPNAKNIVFLTFPEDTGMREELRAATGGDIMFRSHLYVEKIPDPVVVGCALFDGVMDKTSLAQAFCQGEVIPRKDEANEVLAAAEKFMRDLGRTVRQEKGFHVSPLFVSTAGTMSQQNSSHLSANVNFTSGQKRSEETLLDATYSNATPSKLVRVSSVITTRKGRNAKSVERVDGRNVLRVGARTLVRELCQSRHVPWAVMRAPGKLTVTPDEVGQASRLFNLSLSQGKKLSTPSLKTTEEAKSHLNDLIQSVHTVIREISIFLPNGVVEMNPDSIVPPQYDLEEKEEKESRRPTGMTPSNKDSESAEVEEEQSDMEKEDDTDAEDDDEGEDEYE